MYTLIQREILGWIHTAQYTARETGDRHCSRLHLLHLGLSGQGQKQRGAVEWEMHTSHAFRHKFTRCETTTADGSVPMLATASADDVSPSQAGANVHTWLVVGLKESASLARS